MTSELEKRLDEAQRKLKKQTQLEQEAARKAQKAAELKRKSDEKAYDKLSQQLQNAEEIVKTISSNIDSKRTQKELIGKEVGTNKSSNLAERLENSTGKIREELQNIQNHKQALEQIKADHQEVLIKSEKRLMEERRNLATAKDAAESFMNTHDTTKTTDEQGQHLANADEQLALVRQLEDTISKSEKQLKKQKQTQAEEFKNANLRLSKISSDAEKNIEQYKKEAAKLDQETPTLTSKLASAREEVHNLAASREKYTDVHKDRLEQAERATKQAAERKIAALQKGFKSLDIESDADYPKPQPTKMLDNNVSGASSSDHHSEENTKVASSASPTKPAPPEHLAATATHDITQLQHDAASLSKQIDAYNAIPQPSPLQPPEQSTKNLPLHDPNIPTNSFSNHLDKASQQLHYAGVEPKFIPQSSTSPQQPSMAQNTTTSHSSNQPQPQAPIPSTETQRLQMWQAFFAQQKQANEQYLAMQEHELKLVTALHEHAKNCAATMSPIYAEAWKQNAAMHANRIKELDGYINANEENIAKLNGHLANINKSLNPTQELPKVQEVRNNPAPQVVASQPKEEVNTSTPKTSKTLDTAPSKMKDGDYHNIAGDIAASMQKTLRNHDTQSIPHATPSTRVHPKVKHGGSHESPF